MKRREIMFVTHRYKRMTRNRFIKWHPFIVRGFPPCQAKLTQILSLKPSGLATLDRSEIWQASRHRCCRGASQTSERSEEFKRESRSVETSWDLAVRRPSYEWIEARRHILLLKLWRHQMETFSALLALCAGNPGELSHKGQWRGSLMFSLIWVWIND